jgi:hypothetical protein
MLETKRAVRGKKRFFIGYFLQGKSLAQRGRLKSSKIAFRFAKALSILIAFENSGCFRRRGSL